MQKNITYLVHKDAKTGYYFKNHRKKEEEKILKSFEDEELKKQLDDDELRYLRIAILGLIGIKKEGLPVSNYVNASCYKQLVKIYLRIGGNTDFIQSIVPFRNTVEELVAEKYDKDLEELWEIY